MDALILVDLQNDFLPSGALPVPDGDLVLPIAVRLANCFELVVATQDWHPANHVSFVTQHPGRRVGDQIEAAYGSQTLWPVHAVQDTPGAALSSQLPHERIAFTLRKGTDPACDSYSGFFDAAGGDLGLAAELRRRGATRLFVLGLATDYCVRATALDACRQGFETWLVRDACRGVNVRPGDVERALRELREARVGMVASRDVDCCRQQSA